MTRLSYHVLPDDPLRALNILREAGGLPPNEQPDSADHVPEDPDRA